MDYNETYEVRADGVAIAEYDRETEAVEFMDRLTIGRSGVWKVVRVSTVTVSFVAKA